MSRRMAGVLLLFVLGELGVFYWENHAVVSLNRPAESLVLDARFPDLARAVLARPQVSRRVLERVADVAQQRHDRALHVEALRRIASAVPQSVEARLRLAQALRDAGRLDEAERIYRNELEGAPEGADR